MRRKAIYILIGVAALSMMGVCLWLAKGGGTWDPGWAFDKSRETTTLKVGVSVDDGPFAWATFKNISLVRGKNQGFEIIQGEE